MQHPGLYKIFFFLAASIHTEQIPCDIICLLIKSIVQQWDLWISLLTSLKSFLSLMLNYKHFRYTQLHVPTDLYLICKSISKLNYQKTCHHTVAVNVVMLLDKCNKVLFICVLFFSYKNPKIF